MIVGIGKEFHITKQFGASFDLGLRVPINFSAEWKVREPESLININVKPTVDLSFRINFYYLL